MIALAWGEPRARVVAPAELSALVPRWRRLAAAAVTPNPFYEPLLLLPALAQLAAGAWVEVVVVEDGGGELLLLAPFARVRRWRGLPMEARVLWSYRHCYLGTPLVRAGWTAPALEALFEWAAGAAPLLELRVMDGAGELHDAVRARRPVEHGRHERAVLIPAASAEVYLAAALSGGKRKELRRQERRLAEQGALVFEEIGWREAVDALCALELTGWKGRAGGALALDPRDRAFFVAVAAAAAAEGRLLATALRVDGRPIAVKLSLFAGRRAYALKIAYDEAFARFSPGVLLEVDNIRRIHARGDVELMDSCAAPDHPMIDGLWPDRLPITTSLVAVGGGAGARAFVAATPLLRRAAHWWRS